MAPIDLVQKQSEAEQRYEGERRSERGKATEVSSIVRS